MNRVFMPIVKSLFVTALAVSTIASAGAATPQAAAKVDPAKGEALYVNGDGARNIVACVSCHGAAGNSTISLNPKLAAQHDAYLHKQLVDFTGATRNNAVMTGFAKALSDEDMKNIAAYLSAQKPGSGAAKNKDTIEAGKKIYRAGIAGANIPACAGCHSPSGAGIPAQYPRIGGQHQDYTAAQLIGFRSGTRSNSVQMTAIAKRMTDDEIKAVSDYVAGLK
ncbi:MAG: c-type cytochrome [Burkholderiaceae bacterium]